MHIVSGSSKVHACSLKVVPRMPQKPRGPIMLVKGLSKPLKALKGLKGLLRKLMGLIRPSMAL